MIQRHDMTIEHMTSTMPITNPRNRNNPPCSSHASSSLLLLLLRTPTGNICHIHRYPSLAVRTTNRYRNPTSLRAKVRSLPTVLVSKRSIRFYSSVTATPRPGLQSLAEDFLKWQATYSGSMPPVATDMHMTTIYTAKPPW